MDLSTTYLGMKLRTPLVVSASPLSESLDDIKRMEDAGAAAVVLYSLFEEQIEREQRELEDHLLHATDSFAEAVTFFPEPVKYMLGPQEYLEHIRKAKAAVKIPIIASLNGISSGGWTEYAKRMQEAGADAIELNIYYIPTDPLVTGSEIEKSYIDILRAVKSHVSIPIAVKLSPFFSNLANMARWLDTAGANGLVLFNRFYQPDIHLESLEVRPNIILSTPQDLRLPMRWIAILYGEIEASLAATSGIHTAHDVLKMLMAGANVTQLCSALFRHGINYIRVIERDLHQWMDEHEYESVHQLLGSMSQLNYAHPDEFERAQYVRSLQSFRLSRGSESTHH